MSQRGLARQRAMRQPLSVSNIPGVLARLLPRASNYRPANYEELVGELNHFGIRTKKQLRQLVLRNRRQALRIDRTPLDAVNQRIYRAELGENEYRARIRTNTWFAWEGLIRIILELHFGDRYRDFAKARDGA
jgi:hypothetical protein